MTGPMLAAVPVAIVGHVCLVVLGMCLITALVRVVKGPTQADRVVALDTMTVTAAAMIALYAIVTDEPMLIRVTLAMALVAFMGTVALARVIALRGRP